MAVMEESERASTGPCDAAAEDMARPRCAGHGRCSENQKGGVLLTELWSNMGVVN